MRRRKRIHSHLPIKRHRRRRKTIIHMIDAESLLAR
jgi:hypothetical protein